MPVALEIADETLNALSLSPSEAAVGRKRDLAVVLYAPGALPLGKAAGLFGITRTEFESHLARLQIIRPFSEEELNRDLAWTKS